MPPIPPLPWRRATKVVEPLSFMGPFADAHLAWWLLKGHDIDAQVHEAPDGQGRLEVTPGRTGRDEVVALVARMTPSLVQHDADTERTPEPVRPPRADGGSDVADVVVPAPRTPEAPVEEPHLSGRRTAP